MAVPIVVPDASVILKWVLPSEDEADLERAVALRDAIVTGVVHARVPALWLYEVGNTLARRFPDRAERVLDVLLRFDLSSAPPSPRWLRIALELVDRYDGAPTGMASSRYANAPTNRCFRGCSSRR